MRFNGKEKKVLHSVTKGELETKDASTFPTAKDLQMAFQMAAEEYFQKADALHVQLKRCRKAKRYVTARIKHLSQDAIHTTFVAGKLYEIAHELTSCRSFEKLYADALRNLIEYRTTGLAETILTDDGIFTASGQKDVVGVPFDLSEVFKYLPETMCTPLQKLTA